MTHSVLTPAIRDAVGRLEGADVLIGIPGPRTAATVDHVVRAVQVGLVQAFPGLRPVLVHADTSAVDDDLPVTIETESPDYLEATLLVRPVNQLRLVSLEHPPVNGIRGPGAAVRTILELAAALDVRAVVLIDSDQRSMLPEWIDLLAGPVLKGAFEYVTPFYTRHRFDGPITNTLVYPLTRALYGQRIRQPIGGDVGFSGNLVRHYLDMAGRAWSDDVTRVGIDIWLTTEALAGGFSVCQARLGAKSQDGRDSGVDLASTFRASMRTTIELAGRHADTWTRAELGRDVPTYGFERMAEAAPIRVDPVRLLGQFEAGATEFRDTWTAMLGPATASAVLGLAVTAAGVGLSARDWLNLDRGADIARLDTATLAGAMATFQFPDEVWARVVYDVLVAERRAELALDDLVNALVPIWFGRVASSIVESRWSSATEAEELVERQARAFERIKPEFVERWSANSSPVDRRLDGGAASSLRTASSA